MAVGVGLDFAGQLGDFGIGTDFFPALAIERELLVTRRELDDKLHGKKVG